MIRQRDEDVGASVETTFGTKRFLGLDLEDLFTASDAELSNIAGFIGVRASRAWLDERGGGIRTALPQSRQTADVAPELRVPTTRMPVPFLNNSDTFLH
ncbi:hypothetical protein [Gymnodinialimonas sp.]